MQIVTHSVTVIIAAYNSDSTIERAIRSALDQSCEPNVIVVDDASSDQTVKVARAVIGDNQRGKVILQDHNQGPSAARNRGLAAAQTDWVTPLDADDSMTPNRLDRMVTMAVSNNWDAIADDQYRISSWASDAPKRRLWSDSDFGKLELSLERFVRENISDHTGFGRELGYIKPLIKRDFLTNHDIYYDADMRLGEDYDLYARLLLRGAKFGLVDPLGYLAFDTPGSLSRAHRSGALQKLVGSDRRLLSDRMLPSEARKTVIEHMRLNQKKVAWAKLGESFHERAPLKALSSFATPPMVMGDTLSRLFPLIGRKLGFLKEK
ncbi:MAG: glycosyltransferase family 2 protein [Pseudomonadota bacterium]